MSEKLRIESISIRNIKGVARVEADGLAGASVIILAGLNGAGKSTVTETLASFFPGGGVPPLRQGAESGFGRFTFDNGMVAERTIPGGIRVSHPDGSVYPRGKEMLQGFLGVLGGVSLDPHRIVSMQPRERRAMVASLVGADTAQLDARKRELLDDLRTAKRSCDAIETEFKGAPRYEDAPDEPVSIAKLSETLSFATAANAKIERHRDQTKGLRDDAQRLADQLARLEEQAAQARKELASHETEIAERVQYEQNLTTFDVQAVEDQIRDAEAVNEKVRANAAYRSARARWNEAEDARVSVVTELESVEEERRAMLESASFPVEGMGFDEGDITLGGIPWNDLSSGEQARLAAAARIASGGGEAAFGFIDGQDLDPVRRQEIYRQAAEAGMQLIVEISDPAVSEGDRVLLIEDGELR